MFGISGFELLIIAVFVLIIFGPDKIPQLARTVGSAMKMFKSAQQDMEKLIRAEMGPSTPADLLTPAKTGDSATEAGASSATPGGAATVWAATAEDDEEEDEE